MATTPKPIRKLEKILLQRHSVRTGKSVKKIQRSFKKSKIKQIDFGRHYILKGKTIKKVDFHIWVLWFECFNHRIVKQTFLPGNIKVSTIFLGLDHGWSFDEDAPPILFETMIFGGDYDQYQNRYATYDQAWEGHQKAIELSFQVP